MKHLWIVIAALILPAAPAMAEPPRTVIEDQAEAELLLGKHLFADARISIVGNMSSYGNFGKAVVENTNGIYSLNAFFECYSQQPFSYFEPKGGYAKQAAHLLFHAYILIPKI